MPATVHRTATRIIRGASRDLRRTWPQLLLTDLLARALSVIVVAPIVMLLLELFLLFADDGVLTDADIAVFFLHPLGLVAAGIVGAVGLGALFVETGMLMTIGFGAGEDRRVTWLDALWYVARHLPDLGRLAGAVVVRVGLLAVPFAAGIGGAWLLFLREHDINYYLAARPPEFWKAVALAGALLAGMALVGLRLLGGWLLGLPLVLFGGASGKAALRLSARILAGRAWTMAGLLGSWVAGLALASWVVTFGVGLLGDRLVPDFGGSLVLLTSGLVLTLLVAGLANLALSVLAAALFSLLVARLYRTFAGPGRLDPAPAAPGTLGARPGVSIPGKWILVAAAGAVLLVVAGGVAASRALEAEQEVLVIAHRGASGAAPENTMAAFERAIVERADWIELDVQEDADGVVVVAHDSDFMKVAGSSLRVREATAADLRELDIGSWFDPAFADQRVQTLEQVLEAVRGRIGVVIELKYDGHDRQLESRVVDVVERTGMQDHIMLMSLQLPGLRKAAAMRADWPRGLLNTVSVGGLTRLDVDFLALNARAATMPMIRRAHRAGRAVYAWTIDDPVQMSVLMSRGVDGIITDEPLVARRVLELRDQLGMFGRLLLWVAGETGLLRGVGEPSGAEDA